jgi:hypothetical protein
MRQCLIKSFRALINSTRWFILVIGFKDYKLYNCSMVMVAFKGNH